MITNFLSTIKNTLDSVKMPAIPVPPYLINMGAPLRSGISPAMVAVKVISKQSEAGAPYGPNEDGSANIAEAMERIRVETIVDALKNDAQVQITIPPGAISIIGKGESAAGPVVVEGTNINIVNAFGIIQ